MRDEVLQRLPRHGIGHGDDRIMCWDAGIARR